jgi:hypothetical protein
VSSFLERGISFHSVLPFPISVETSLFPNISDFKSPDCVVKVINDLLFSFDNKSATHLVPFPHAPEVPPSEL